MALYENPRTGEQKEFDNQADATAEGFYKLVPTSPSTPDYGTSNWAGSNKLVADFAYVENGTLYFVYNVSPLFDAPTYVAYAATGVSPSQYKGNWGADGSGKTRTGPRIGSKPAGLVIDGGNFAYFNLGAGNAAQGIDPLPDSVKLVDLIDEGYRTLIDNYGFFFDEVNGEYPGMELLFSRLGQGLSVSPTDLQNAGIGANVPQLKLDYLNATVANRDSDNPFVYMVNGEEVVNQKYVNHYNNVQTILNQSLEDLNFDADIFEKENKLFYKQLLNTLVKGDISKGLMKDFIGYILGVKGYESADDDALNKLFSTVKGKVNNEQFSLSSSVYANALEAENLAIQKIGLANYQALSDSKKNEIIIMYGDSPDAAKQMLQGMFEEYYPQYAGKNLDFASIKGKYATKWSAAFNETPDETNDVFLDGMNLTASEASKKYMEHAYKTGNEFFMRKIATNLQQSLGGPVIR